MFGSMGLRTQMILISTKDAVGLTVLPIRCLPSDTVAQGAILESILSDSGYNSKGSSFQTGP